MKRALFVLLLTACDPSETSLYTPTYDPLSDEPVASMEFCALLARNTCAVLRPCCNALPFAFDEIKCRSSSRALCEARRVKSMELGLAYDDLQAGRCVRGTAILLPGCRSPEDPVAADVIEACRNVWNGGRAIDETCKFDNPVDCRPPKLGVRVECVGRCREKVLLAGGESCATRPLNCAPGLVCEGDPRRCTAKYHPLGAPCTPTSIPEIDRCDTRLDRFCDSSSGTCKTLPTLGQPCSASPGCARPYRCDTDRTGAVVCAEGKPIGASCNDDKECSSKICGGGGAAATALRICVPSGLGPPIVPLDVTTHLPIDPHARPVEYVSAIGAACSGVIAEGAGGLAAFEVPRDK
jgi:hypothetical protein